MFLIKVFELLTYYLKLADVIGTYLCANKRKSVWKFKLAIHNICMHIAALPTHILRLSFVVG